MMGMILCNGKEIGVQSGGVARRLWRWPWSVLIAPLLLIGLGPAAIAVAHTPPASSVYGAASRFSLPHPAVARQSPTPPPGPPGEHGDFALLPEVRAGFDGISKAGRALSVRAVVANDGPPIDGRLRLTMRAGGD